MPNYLTPFEITSILCSCCLLPVLLPIVFVASQIVLASNVAIYIL